MFNKGKHDKRALGTSGTGRAFKTVGYALAGTALLGFSTVQSGLVNPQAIAETSAGGDTPTTDDANVHSTLAYSSAAKASEKDETVYVFANPDGSVKNTKVSAELRNPKKAKTLKDQTELKNVENTENDGEHATTSEGTVWETKGKDVYYMGDTDKEAPVKMKVSYKLGGKDIEAKDLLGKSGRVTIRFDFRNDSYETKKVNGKETKIFTPFMALTGMLFDNDQFKNVKAKNAKVVDDGDRTIVAGYALPGLQESLDLDEDTYKVPDYIQVSGDTDDFEMNQTLTMVTNDLFSDTDTDKLDTDKLDDAIDQLQSGMDQLIDGSGELVTGLNNLSSGAHTLSSGAGTLAAGTHTLAAGTHTLKTSTASLPGSVKKLDNGMQSLSKGLGSASSGARQLKSGTGSLHDSLELFKNGNSKQTGLSDALAGIGNDDDMTQGTLIGGVNLMKTGVDGSIKAMPTALQAVDQLFASNQKNSKAIAKTLKTLASSQETIDDLNKKIAALPDDGSVTLQALKAELSGLQAKIVQAKTEVSSAKSMLSGVSSSLGSIDTGALASDAQAAGADARTAAATAAEAQKAAAGLAALDTSGMTDSQKTAVANAQKALANSAGSLASSAKSSGALATDVSKLGSSLSNLPTRQQLQEISNSLDEVDGYLSTENLAKANRYLELANNLVNSLDGDEIGADTKLLKTYCQAIEKYLSSIDPNGSEAESLKATLDGLSKTGVPALTTLSQGLASEKQGLIALRDGGKTADGRQSSGISGAVKALGNDSTKNTLINGASQLNSGAGSLSNGLGSAVSGSVKLAAGTSQLNGAAPKLYNGIVSLDSGAAQLQSGADRLSSGSQTLAKGADSAAKGAKTLANGLKTYNRKGIKKIVDAYNDNLKGLSSRLTAVRDASRDYTNFTGIAKGTKGKVKFVYETDAVQHDDDE